MEKKTILEEENLLQKNACSMCSICKEGNIMPHSLLAPENLLRLSNGDRVLQVPE